MSSQLPKTRVIPIGDFYTRLQLEYISYKFRSLIYHRIFDKKKFAEISDKKRDKINQIALENSLPSIFNNKEQQKRYLIRFFGTGGIPAFCYRDEYQSTVKGYWDLFYYFIVGASVRVLINENVEIGKIVASDIKQKILTINVSNDKYTMTFENVTRIFPSNFYDTLFI